jgi:hypothetical protein
VIYAPQNERVRMKGGIACTTVEHFVGLFILLEACNLALLELGLTLAKLSNLLG